MEFYGAKGYFLKSKAFIVNIYPDRHYVRIGIDAYKSHFSGSFYRFIKCFSMNPDASKQETTIRKELKAF